MIRRYRLSLAAKCQLLFGLAVILIITAALVVVMLRMQKLVREGQEEKARQLVTAWLEDRIQLGGTFTGFESFRPDELPGEGFTPTLIEPEEFGLVAQRDSFLANAIERFQTRPDSVDRFTETYDQEDRRYFRYARAIRKSDTTRIHGFSGFTPTLDTTSFADPLEMVLLIEFRAPQAEQQLMLNRVWLIAAGLLAGLLAIGTFWFITTRLILSPVRVLRETAEKVSEGDLNVRSDINTGDEFEQLAAAFNHMLASLKDNQDQLQQINKSLDLRLVELAETNHALYEANKIKGDFLANVSHELRTPLNSIVGFAELAGEQVPRMEGKPREKTDRYVNHIITSSKRLLGLINELLDLAKIEAGRIELRISPTSLADTAEGLITLVKPLAEKRGVELVLRLEPNLPMVHTDPSRLQQILFNFLSNAIKFSPEGGQVTFSVRRSQDDPPGFVLSVSDQGPGIPADQHEKIFEKFTQLEAGIAKQHEGTGLGLTISRELAQLLQGHIELESGEGQGATFRLIIPPQIQTDPGPLMPEEPAEREPPDDAHSQTHATSPAAQPAAPPA